jgi:nanoRNase/pAp phosphatase (c-di-AMP/oligoRNAs hydrolase)
MMNLYTSNAAKENLKMLDLRNLLDFEEIVIQCHDNPDADTIASGYGLYSFFKIHHKSVKLIYSGNLPISKPNVKMMIKELNIPLEHVKELAPPDLLITVDCQYQSNNVTLFDAHQVCIIDHHMYQTLASNLFDVRPYLASCSTLIWDLLKKASFPFTEHPYVCTALYYGLLTDSNFLTEVRHPLDKDLLDSLQYDKGLIKKFKSSNLSLSDLEIAGIALLRCSTNSKDKFAILKAHPCDPNILGFISDLAIQVDEIEVSIVFFESHEGIKYSIRSCSKEIDASEFAHYLCRGGIGSAGGHQEKAGGFIQHVVFWEKHRDVGVESYFHAAARNYFLDFHIIYDTLAFIKTSLAKLYHKKPTLVGYANTCAMASSDQSLFIRTLYEDIELVCSSDTYVVLSQDGSIRVLSKLLFEADFQPLDTPFLFGQDYTPMIKDHSGKDYAPLTDYLLACLEIGSHQFLAFQVEDNVKLFLSPSSETYTTAMKGDFIVFHPSGLDTIDDLHLEVFSKEAFDAAFEVGRGVAPG